MEESQVGLSRSEPSHESPRLKTVSDLQRELLAICRGGRYGQAMRWPSLPRTGPAKAPRTTKLKRVAKLRKQIMALDPKAALYYGWAGTNDAQPYTG